MKFTNFFIKILFRLKIFKIFRNFKFFSKMTLKKFFMSRLNILRTFSKVCKFSIVIFSSFSTQFSILSRAKIRTNSEIFCRIRTLSSNQDKTFGQPGQQGLVLLLISSQKHFSVYFLTGI